ncbi:hypothetical protein DFS34DRAFT_107356 [Phlyctochytrium arcticum]|nr:hypothetical protein DFS34DRAFT_107356 [Phlyctochytrium arcticum]
MASASTISLSLHPLPGHDDIVQGQLGVTPCFVVGALHLKVSEAARLTRPRLSISLKGETCTRWTQVLPWEHPMHKWSLLLSKNNGERRCLMDEEILLWHPDSIPSYHTSRCLEDDSDTLAQGVHEIPFRFRIPDISPPSVDTPLGNVQYKLKANLDDGRDGQVWRKKRRRKYTTTAPVILRKFNLIDIFSVPNLGRRASTSIMRYCPPPPLPLDTLQATMQTGSNPPSEVLTNMSKPSMSGFSYRVSLASRSIGPDEPVVLHVHVATVPAGYSIKDIEVTLKALVTVRAQLHGKTIRETLFIHKEGAQNTGDFWRKVVTFPLPQSNGSARPLFTFVGPLIAVKHLLKIRFTLERPRGSGSTSIKVGYLPITLHPATQPIKRHLLAYAARALQSGDPDARNRIQDLMRGDDPFGNYTPVRAQQEDLGLAFSRALTWDFYKKERSILCL